MKTLRWFLRYKHLFAGGIHPLQGHPSEESKHWYHYHCNMYYFDLCMLLTHWKPLHNINCAHLYWNLYHLSHMIHYILSYWSVEI